MAGGAFKSGVALEPPDILRLTGTRLLDVVVATLRCCAYDDVVGLKANA